MKSIKWFLALGVVLTLMAACAPAAVPTAPAAQATTAPSQPTSAPSQATTAPSQPTTAPAPASPTTAAAAPTTAAPQTERQKTFVVAYLREPSTIDPSTYYEVETNVIVMGAYESLVKYEGPESKIVPWLAESWDISQDAKTYTFHLRKGVLFQDGEPFNSAAVKFSADREKDINQGPAWHLGNFVDSIDTPDDYTVVFHLKNSSPAWINYASGNWALKFVCPNEVKNHATDQDKWAKDWLKEHACGTGPYQLKEWVHNESLTAVKFDKYWGGWDGQHFDTIIERIVPESSTQRLLLEGGDIDMTAMPLTLEDVQAIQKEKDKGLGCEVHPTPLIYTLFIFTQRKPTDNVKVRRALAYAFNKDAVAKDILGGVLGSSVPGLLYSPAFEGYDPNLPHYTYDLDKAKQLLTDAGYPNGGFTLKLRYQEGNDAFRQIAEMYTADLKKLGITLEVASTPAATWLDLVAKKDQISDLLLGQIMPDNADTYSWFWFQLGSDAVPPANLNLSWYQNPKMDDLLKQGQSELDVTKRAGIYQDIAKLVMEDSPVVQAAQASDVFCLKDEIKGRVYNTWYIYMLWPYNLYRSQ